MKCRACGDEFVWNDSVVIVSDEKYHRDCIELYPIGWFAMTLDGEPIGETENEEGQLAFEIDDGLLEEESEEM